MYRLGFGLVGILFFATLAKNQVDQELKDIKKQL
jgi:hypothetical protein